VADIAPEPAPAPKKAATVKAVPQQKTGAVSQTRPKAKPWRRTESRAGRAEAAAETVEAKGKLAARQVTPITAEAPHPAKHKPNEVAIKSSTSRPPTRPAPPRCSCWTPTC
jgi:PhoH-like ATPase